MTQLAPKDSEFGEIMQNIGHYVVQGHSRSPISVPMESLHATSYVWIIVTYLLSCTVSEIWQIIGPIFAVDSRYLSWTHSFGVNSGVRNLASETRNIPLSYAWREVYFDILNRLGVTHECDRQTHGRTDGRIYSDTENSETCGNCQFQLTNVAYSILAKLSVIRTLI